MSRKQIHVKVSAEAHDRWTRYAGRQGVTLAGLLEALADHLDLVPEAAIQAARTIDHERRAR